jgi:hypothetical protein
VDEPAPVDEPAGAAPTATGAGDELAQVTAKWPAILEAVRERSPRARAVYDPATPERLSGGVLVLRFGPRHSGFHALEAAKPALTEILVAAIERACAITVRIEAVKADQDGRRRPQPPLVTPADAVVPVDAADVEANESERSGEAAAPPAPEERDALLAEGLGAKRVEG